MEYYQHYRIGKKQGMIWRAMGNFMLNNVQLWWVTVSASDKSLNWIESNAVIAPYMRNTLKTWRYRVKTLQYALIASGGDTGRNPHYHIVATSPLPDSLQSVDIDSHCVPIIDSDTDRKKLARYCADNLSQDAPFTSQRFRKSQGFERWANPVINRLYHALKADDNSLVDVYVHNSQKSPLASPVNNSDNDYQTPPLHECYICNNHLPRTSHYYHRDGTRLRTQCKQCQRLTVACNDANRRAKAYGDIGILSPSEIAELHVIAGGVDMWTFEPLTEPSLDHIVALSRGGHNVIDNILICNQSTNSKKGDKTVISWLYELASIGILHPLADSYSIDLRIQRDMFASA